MNGRLANRRGKRSGDRGGGAVTNRTVASGGKVRRFEAIAGLVLVLCLFAASGTPLAQPATQDASAGRGWSIPSDETIRRLLAERLRRNGVGVVVGVIGPGGRRVVAGGRSGAKGVALDGDTEFLIGSVTKAFTTLLLADMVERGEVGLDDPTSKYLPAGVAMPRRGRSITLRDLATHVSGLPSMPTNFDLDAEPDPYSAYTVEQLHAFLSGYVPERAPGEQWAYSNLGVFLLGRLLANGVYADYETLLKERVLEPLGMHDTAITPTPGQLRRLAPGHDRYLQPVQAWEMKVMQGSGSLYSTVDDLLTFVSAYLGYLDSPLKAAMARQWAERSPVRDAQALGWGISRVDGREIVGHRGGKEGYRSAVVFDPKTRTGIVVLANARTEDEPGDLAMHLLTGKPLPPAPTAPAPRKPVGVPAESLSACAGRYRLESGAVMTVVDRRHYLAVETAPGSGISTFLPLGEREFYLNTGNDELTFNVDAEGRVTGLVLHGDGKAAIGGHEEAIRIPAGR